MLTLYYLACEQAPSEVGKKFGERSEWESERRDSASEASGTLGRDSRIFFSISLGACSQAIYYLSPAAKKKHIALKFSRK